MIPIEKNIRVVDAFNKAYEPTYPKRAKGLVKSGRARFVDAETICLTSPPHIHMEDNTMSENSNPDETKTIMPGQPNAAYSIEYALEQLNKIVIQTEHLTRALDALVRMDDGENGAPGSPGNIAGQAKAQAIEEAVRSRETTNQQLIRFYEKMYDDLKPEKPLKPKTGNDLAIINSLIEAAEDLPPIEKSQFFREQLSKFL
jgi:hypothetical protein